MIYFKMEKLVTRHTTKKKKRQRSENLVFNTHTGGRGRTGTSCGHWILSPARWPIPPRRQSITGVAGFEPTHEGVKVPFTRLAIPQYKIGE